MANAAALALAFGQIGHRPRMLERAIVDALNPLAPAPGRFEGRVLEIASERRTREYDALRASFTALKPLERALIWRMLDTGARYTISEVDSDNARSVT